MVNYSQEQRAGICTKSMAQPVESTVCDNCKAELVFCSFEGCQARFDAYYDVYCTKEGKHYHTLKCLRADLRAERIRRKRAERGTSYG